MTTTLSLNISRLLILAASLIIAAFFVINTIFAQSPSPATSPAPEGAPAATSDFQFPVNDLGGCENIEACTNYCEDPTNYNSCSVFAKEHGFYRDDETQYGDDEFWQGTQNELGCNSAESCMQLCSDAANHETCSAFAKRNEIPGGYTKDPAQEEYVETAKNTLGCDSLESCAAFCDDPANSQKCGDFANQVGLQGGGTTEGPGGCQTPETCGAYCSDPNNVGQCQAFAPGGNFSGPGGCNSEESCRSYCDQNPESCRSYAPGTNGAYVPVVCPADRYFGPGGACTPIGDTQAAAACVGADQYWDGSTCSSEPPVGIDPDLASAHFEERPEMGNCQTPGECFDYCKENPGKCEGFDASGSRPTDEYTPYLYYTPGSEVTHAPVESMGGCTSPAGCYDYCKENPGKCAGFSDKAPRPPEIYIPGTYYTPPTNIEYVTPPTTGFYTTPIYYTPPEGSTYTTPPYYTPGMYSTPTYHNNVSNPIYGLYTTPNYYTPWGNYTTPTGEYPTPTYATPTYYTPPAGSNYTTPYYYTPPQYYTPYYYTPGTLGIASNYTTPSYATPPPYTTPQYYTPWEGGGYTTPVYYTPPVYTTPTYYTPPPGSPYTTPSYYTPPPPYTTPTYYTPGQYPTPITYTSPPPYTSPTYYSPSDPNYTTPTYYTPTPYTTPTYYTPTPYSTPYYYTPYTTPTYYSPSDPNYTTPTYYTPYTTPN
ncbi:MAG: hypothetical protein CEO21_304, partial [Microgenomates group bacterium Gr01-1014_80]